MPLIEPMTDGVAAVMHDAERVELAGAINPVFVSWDQFGTRYRIFAFSLRTLSERARQEVGANEHTTLVTLWIGKTGVSVLFQFGGSSPLPDAYVGQRLGLKGEDLEAVAPKLRALLMRGGA